MEKLPRIPSPPGTAFREIRARYVPFLAFACVMAATPGCVMRRSTEIA